MFVQTRTQNVCQSSECIAVHFHCNTDFNSMVPLLIPLTNLSSAFLTVELSIRLITAFFVSMQCIHIDHDIRHELYVMLTYDFGDSARSQPTYERMSDMTTKQQLSLDN